MDKIFEARVRKETGIPDDYPINGLTLGIRTIMHELELKNRLKKPSILVG